MDRSLFFFLLFSLLNTALYPPSCEGPPTQLLTVRELELQFRVVFYQYTLSASQPTEGHIFPPQNLTIHFIGL